MPKSFADVLQNYPIIRNHDGKKRVREMVEKFLEKPSRDLEIKLRRFGIGVNWSHEYGEDIQQVESFFLMDRTGEESEPISDELLGELLR